jgi:hypothetical protein
MRVLALANAKSMMYDPLLMDTLKSASASLFNLSYTVVLFGLDQSCILLVKIYWIANRTITVFPTVNNSASIGDPGQKNTFHKIRSPF